MHEMLVALMDGTLMMKGDVWVASPLIGSMAAENAKEMKPDKIRR